VENLFYFSFLVKDGVAGMLMGRAGSDPRTGEAFHAEPWIAVYESTSDAGFANPQELALDSRAGAGAEAGVGDEAEGADVDDGAAVGAGAASSAQAGRRVHIKAASASGAGAARQAASRLEFGARQFIIHLDQQSYRQLLHAFGMADEHGRAVRGYRPALRHYGSTDSAAPPGLQLAANVGDDDEAGEEGAAGGAGGGVGAGRAGSSSSGAGAGAGRRNAGAPHNAHAKASAAAGSSSAAASGSKSGVGLKRGRAASSADSDATEPEYGSDGDDAASGAAGTDGEAAAAPARGRAASGRVAATAKLPGSAVKRRRGADDEND
jgi:hypothetical protein